MHGELFLSVHGCDFTITGPRNQVEWLKAKFQGKYEVKTPMLGMAEGLEKEARVLNRTLRFTKTAVEYEPDRRQQISLFEICFLKAQNQSQRQRRT